jgi:hypothetical protein
MERMQTSTDTKIFIVGCLALVVLGCLVLLVIAAFLQFYPPGQPESPDAVYTQAAQTIVAEVTRSAGETAIAPLTQIAQVSPTPTPSQLPPTLVSLPTATPWPTLTSIPVWPTQPPPPPPPPTAVPPPCDWAQFVMDITVPDKTTFPANAGFTKVWRLRNIGSCTWSSGYTLVFTGGDRMSAYNAYPLPHAVAPGQNVDLAVNLTAPSTPGRYKSFWMLANPRGGTFGIGPGANNPFWVDIRVIAINNQYAYDFAGNMCSAAWSSSSARYLPCPGDPGSPDGSIVLLTEPVLETGKHENEPTLWTRPQATRGGWIKGAYPGYTVQNGDHFMADIGCLDRSPECDVTFSLDYMTPGQPIRGIGSWREIDDAKLTRLDIDLSSLAGQTVQFILTVTNNGRPADANAFWLVPSVRRVSSSPTPTSTPTRTQTPTPTSTPTVTTTPDWSNEPAVQAARQAVAAGNGVPIDQVILVSAQPVQWTDTCLGVPYPGQICGPALIPGYRVILRINAQQFEAHTNQDGSIVAWFPI